MSEKIYDPSFDTKKSWWVLPAKITFILAALALTFMTVLSVMGGNSATLKETVEGIVAQSTGYRTEIKTFHGLEFFPSVKLDFEDLNLFNAEGDVVAELEKFSLSMSFWDVMFRSGKFSKLDVQNLYARQGVFMDQPIHIKSVDVKRSDEEKAELDIRGKIGEKPVDASVDLKVLGRSPYFKYQFANPRLVKLVYGDFKLVSKMEDVRGLLELSDLQFSYLDDVLAEGVVVFSGHDVRQIELKGELKFPEYGSVLAPDLILDFTKERPFMRGDFVAKHLYLPDFKEESKLSRGVEVLRSDLFDHPEHDEIEEISAESEADEEEAEEQIVRDSKDRPEKPEPEEAAQEQADLQKESDINLKFADLDLRVEIEKFYSNEIFLASLSGPVELNNGHLSAKNMKGKFSEGALKFSFDLDASKPLASLSTELSVDNLHYGELQKRLGAEVEVTGFADLTLNLSAQGYTTQELLSSMSGHFDLKADKGELKSNAVNLWGSGLFSSMLPSLDPASELVLNCAVADFDIEEGKAKAKTLFMDTKRVTVVGEGDYDFTGDDLDIKLKPKSKGVAIGDISPGIIVSGSISSPSFNPSVVDLGTQIGGLLLSTVNPAALLVSAVDFTGEGKHPCAQFIEGYELPQEKPEVIEPGAGGGLNE